MPLTSPLPEAGPLALLLDWHLDPLVSGGALGLALGYVWLYRRRAGSVAWPLWRVLCFGAGVLLLLAALQSSAVQYSLNSMALYMVRLMLLAEAVPLLLLLGIPAEAARNRSRLPGVLLDPWVAVSVWTTVIVVWNLPVSFSASLVGNTAAALLPALYLVGGLLSWAVTLDRTPSPLPEWRRGLCGLLASLPMMLVGLVWLFAPGVLYAPYVGALCLWNLTPLQNQQLSGVVMLVAGVPLMGVAAWQLGRVLSLRLQSPGDFPRRSPPSLETPDP